MTFYILDAKGEVVATEDVLVWAEWFEEGDRQLALTYIENMTVSTVFVGLDRSWGMDGRGPELWETMVFGAFTYYQFTRRYRSKADALEGHTAVCAEVATYQKHHRR